MNDIPFVDLELQGRHLRSEVMEALEGVLDSRAFIQGRFVEEFASSFLEWSGLGYGTGCSNGTAAISLALEALGVGPGDEVITVAHSFVATAEAIIHVGATPVFVDVDPDTYTMDPDALEAAFTPRTRAVMPVHLYGTPAHMDRIAEFVQRRGMFLVEDCAQAHGARFQDRPVGSFGDAATFSFYPGKNLGAYGDAGFVAGRDADLIKRVSQLLDHGRSTKYEHEVVGYNHRMDGMQAAVLSVKLRHLTEWTRARRKNAALYRERLVAAGIHCLGEPEGSEPVFHLFVIEVDDRDLLRKVLREAGIATGIHYPVPLHLQPALKSLGYSPGSLPVTEKASERVLSLPMYPELTEAQIEHVCSTVITAVT